MAFPIPVTAALSGNSIGQLQYWRSTGLLHPEVRDSRPILYSFRDVVALRTVAYLRDETSLQQIRRALRNLRILGEYDHLSKYRLVRAGRSIAWAGQDATVDLLEYPGQPVLAYMQDILGSFINRDDVQVPELKHPRPNLSVLPEVRGGYPVIRNTRLPYDLVADLVDDGVQVDDVKDFYPRVTADAATDAADFAHYVDSFGPLIAAS